MNNDVIEAFADYLGATRSPSTVRAYVGHLDRLHRKHPDLLAVTVRELEHTLRAMRDAGYAPESRKAFRTAARAFYRWTHRMGLTDHDPAGELEAVSVPARPARIANDDELTRALKGATLRDKGLILAGRLAGLRLTEIATLHTSCNLRDRLRIDGKGEKRRDVPLHEELAWTLAVIERELGPGYYFPGLSGPGHMHPQSVNKAITRATGVNPHSLRHAAATAFYRSSGNNLDATRQFLGHASVATTQRYLHQGFEVLMAGIAGAGLQSRL